LNYYRASPLHPSDESGASVPAIDPETFRVRVPTLVIWGERDEALLPGNLNGLEEMVSDLRIERIPDGSHWVVHEQPRRVNALIRAFASS
jgi:pimeloyl-ACP methyl ester carboxylesterase